jgi:DnaJ family protein C protein 9
MEHLRKGEDLYATLGVAKDATPDEIRRAYYKAALLCHPDRCTENKEEATQTFQKLGFINSILSDPTKRKLYDDTGDFGAAVEDLDMDTVQTWKAYFDGVFNKVTETEIDSFAGRYKGSAEEREDIKAAYTQGDGSMDVIVSHVPLAGCSEEDRFRTIVEAMFEAKELEPTAQWKKTNTAAAIRKRLRAEEAEKALYEKEQKKQAKAKAPKATDLETLQAAIAARHKASFTDLIGRLEKAYGADEPESSGKKRKPAAAPKKAAKKKSGGK